MSRRWLVPVVVTVLLALTPAIRGVASTGGGGDGTSVACPLPVPALAVGQSQSGSVDVSGGLTLYCRSTGTDSRAGTYSPGSVRISHPPAPTPAPPGDPSPRAVPPTCSVDVPFEQVQVLGQASEVGTNSSQNAVDRVWPVALWTGTVDATITVEPAGTILDGLSDTATQTVGAAAWVADGRRWRAAPVGPAPPPSIGGGSGVATGLWVSSGLQNQVLTASILTTAPGAPGPGGLCYGPRVLVRIPPPAVIDRSPAADVPPSESTWTAAAELEAKAEAQAQVGPIESDIPPGGNFLVQAPNCFWLAHPFSETAAHVHLVLGQPDPEGESVVYSYYLQVVATGLLANPSADGVDWYFGDGTSWNSSVGASGPGGCVAHTFTTMDGSAPGPDVAASCQRPDTVPGVPSGGATVIACEPISVVSYVGWRDPSNAERFACVTPGSTRLTPLPPATTQAQTRTACQSPLPVLVAGSLTRPVYQVRPVPLS